MSQSVFIIVSAQKSALSGSVSIESETRDAGGEYPCALDLMMESDERFGHMHWDLSSVSNVALGHLRSGFARVAVATEKASPEAVAIASVWVAQLA